MADAAGTAKPYIPLMPGTVDRPRLLDRLERAIEHRLTLLSAPPGYGKTTLISQFARRTAHPVAWHTIEERERDLPAFYQHALLSLQLICPDITTDLPAAEEYSAVELATLLSDYLREHLAEPALLVLDDVHHLDGAPPAELFLRTLIESAPRQVHFVLSSRSVPDLPFVELIARSDVLALGAYELRMTDGEIDSLAELLLSQAPVASTMREVIARLDGWPAGIMLALQPLPLDLGDAILGGDGGPEALFEALADRMLVSQPPDLRNFLLTSSILSYLTPELCSKVLELANPNAWLSMLQTRNLFVSTLPDSLAYHPLFRNFLQRQLQTSNMERFIALHTRAAHWFEDRDDLVRAFDHYMSAGLVEQAAALAERTAIAYFGQGRIQTLLAWSARLADFNAEPPGLLIECAMAHSDRYEFKVAEAKLERAEAIFEERGDREGVNKVLLPRARIKLQSGDYHEAIKLALRAAEESSSAVRGRALRVVGMAQVHLGSVANGIRTLEQAAELHRDAGLQSGLSHLLQDLQYAYTRFGRLEEAGACLQEAVALRRGLGGAAGLALGLNNLGCYHYLSNDYEQALSTLEEGLRIIAGVPDRRVEGHLLWSMGDLRRDLGAFGEAALLYDKALDLLFSGGDPNTRCSILTSKAVLRRRQGRHDEAVVLAREAIQIAEDHQIAFEGLLARAALWATYAEQGQAEQALIEMEQIARMLLDQDAHFELMTMLGICCYLCLLRGDLAKAGDYLSSAMQVASGIGSAQPLAAEIAASPPLEAFVAGFDHDQLKRDLARLRAASARLNPASVRVEPGSPAPMSASLRVFTLGREAVELNSRPVPGSAWRSVAARELFLYLLFTGPCTRGDLALVFWPDADTDQARSSFHTTLHRARGALGKDVITFQDDTYLVNPNLTVWCDARELETFTSQARVLPPGDARTEDLLRKATLLYQGDFLPSLDAEWVVARREMLREMNVEALVGLGQAGWARSDFRGALDSYGAVLKVDPYREDVHRLVMQCYARLGEKTQVLNRFNELKKLLREELGIEPAKETRVLVESLLS